MHDDCQHEPSHLQGVAIVSATTALLIHGFVLAMLAAAALNLLGAAEFYKEWEISQVTVVLRLARLLQFGWYLLILPLLVDAALVVWLASKPSLRWLLTWLNYLALGGALMMVTVAFGLTVKPLMHLIPN